jgi:hypothetical protein
MGSEYFAGQRCTLGGQLGHRPPPPNLVGEVLAGGDHGIRRKATVGVSVRLKILVRCEPVVGLGRWPRTTLVLT